MDEIEQGSTQELIEDVAQGFLKALIVSFETTVDPRDTKHIYGYPEYSVMYSHFSADSCVKQTAHQKNRFRLKITTWRLQITYKS